MRKSEYLLYSKIPGEFFTDAYPVGNGKLGGMVYGGYDVFKIGLNHDEIWSTGESSAYGEYDKKAFDAAKTAALNGDYYAATEYLKSGFAKYDCAAFLPLCDMLFGMPVGEVTDYERTLDIKNSEFNVSYKLNGKNVSVKVIASYPHNVIAVKFNFEQPSMFTFSIKSPLEASASYNQNTAVLRGKCFQKNANHKTHNSLPKDRVDAKTVAFSAVFNVVTDGQAVSDSEKITVNNASETVVYFTAATSFKNGKAYVVENYEDIALATINKAVLDGYDVILNKHLKDYARLYKKSAEISLGDKAPKTLVTADRIKDYSKTGSDLDLITLTFNYAKYLLISGSRKGSRALNLQGVWNDRVDAPWSSDYTTNINTEMNYWPALGLGLEETLQPLEEQIKLIRKTGKPAAKKLFGSSGVCASHNTDIFGFVYPTRGLPRWSYFPLSIHWLSKELYNKYEYTGNEKYLNKIYPLFEDLVKFILDMLVFDGKYYIFTPASSAENCFSVDGKIAEVAKSSEFFAAIIRDTSASFIKMSEKLNKTSETYRKIKEIYPKLLPTLITDDGRIAEWYLGDGKNNPDEVEVNHRHVSHLFAMFPGNEISVNDKVYADAVRKTLEVRGDESTGWSLTWKMNLYAKLLDGAAVKRLINLFFYKMESSGNSQVNCSKGGVYNNLFCAHPPFQIDGNFGFASAVLQMLVQEIDGETVALPVKFDGLTTGKVKRIRLKNNKKIDFTIKNGKAEDVKIY